MFLFFISFVGVTFLFRHFRYIKENNTTCIKIKKNNKKCHK